MPTTSMRFLLAAIVATIVLPLLAESANAQRPLRGVVRVAGEYGGDKVVEFEYSDGSTPDVTAGGGLLLTAGGVATLFTRAAHAAEAQVNVGLKYRTIPPADNQEATWLRFPLEGLVFYRMPAGVRLGVGATVHLRNVLEVSGEVATDRLEFETSPGLLLQADYLRGDVGFDLRYTALQYELAESGTGTIDASSIGVGFSYFFGGSSRPRPARKRTLAAEGPDRCPNCAPSSNAAVGPIEEQVAKPIVAPGVPPDLHAMLDSAALHAALAAVPDARGEKRTARVFRIVFDSAGQPQPVKPAVPAVMPDEYRAAVAPLIQSALRPLEPRRGGWQALLLVRAGPAPRVEQVVLPERRPELVEMPALRRALTQSAQELVRADPALMGRRLRVHVTMRVDEHGLAGAPAVHSSSGNSLVDSAALRTVQVLRFAPALLDNEPVAFRVVIPIHFVFPAED